MKIKFKINWSLWQWKQHANSYFSPALLQCNLSTSKHEQSCKTLNYVFLNISATFMKKTRLLNPKEYMQTCPNYYLVFLLEMVFWVPLLTPSSEKHTEKRTSGDLFPLPQHCYPSPSAFRKAFRFWQCAGFFCVQLPRGIENRESEGCN